MNDSDKDWVPAPASFVLNVGDLVRVRPGSFSGQIGMMHNGRVGRIMSKEHGDIVVEITDERSPKISNAHYSWMVIDTYK